MKRSASTCRVVLLLVCLTVTARAQCPNIVGTWTGTVSFVTETTGYTSGITSTHVVDQQGCRFRGFEVGTIVIGPGAGGVDTNNFVGVLQKVKGNTFAISVPGNTGGMSSGVLTVKGKTKRIGLVALRPGNESQESVAAIVDLVQVSPSP